MRNFFKNQRLSGLLIEIAVIVFSVLLALAVNEWRQERNNRRMVERVMKNIGSEIRQNQEGLSHAYEYHQKLVSDLREGRHVRLVESVPLREVDFKLNDIKSFREGMKEKMLNYGISPTVGFGMQKISEERYGLYVGTGEGYVEIKNDSLKIYMQKGIQLRSAFVQNNAWELYDEILAILEKSH